VDSKVIKNYIIPSILKRLKMLYRQKLEPYILVTILKDLILYKDRIINLKTRLVKVSIKRQSITVLYNKVSNTYILI
jgi:hypothetical protein